MSAARGLRVPAPRLTVEGNGVLAERNIQPEGRDDNDLETGQALRDSALGEERSLGWGAHSARVESRTRPDLAQRLQRDRCSEGDGCLHAEFS